MASDRVVVSRRTIQQKKKSSVNSDSAGFYFRLGAVCEYRRVHNMRCITKIWQFYGIILFII